MVDATLAINFVKALNSKFEDKQLNKKNDISGDFSEDTTSYPTVTAVKSYFNSLITTGLAQKLNISQPSNKNKNVYVNSSGNIAFEDKITKTSQLTNDAGFLEASDIASKQDKSNLITSWTNDDEGSTYQYPSESLIKSALDDKVDKESGKGLFSGSYNDLTNKPNINQDIENYLDALTTSFNES